MKNIFFILLALTPCLSLASPPEGSVVLRGSCSIDRESVITTVPFRLSFGSQLFELGYKGLDGGDYEINVVNNGGSQFENEQGAIQIGFARASGEVRNPPLLCPTSPEEARLACEERNRINNPPFVPAPSDHFRSKPNVSGTVKYEIVGSNPDNMRDTRTSVSGQKLLPFQEVMISAQETLGGVTASCILKATRY